MEYFIPENIHITCMDKLKTPPSPSPKIPPKFDLLPGRLGPVVQSWVNANPGLKFDLPFWFVYLYASKETKITVDPDKIFGEIFRIV